VKSSIEPAEFRWFDYQRYTFSLGLTVGSTAYLSGHSASEFDPGAGRITVRGGMAEQTRTAYDKIAAILQAAGLDFADVIRLVEHVTVRGIDDYGDAERVRAEAFGDHRPAVNTVVVNALLRPEALIEIEVVARKGGGEPLAVTADGRRAHAPARAADGVVYLSSVLPLGEDGALVEGDVEAQTRRIYRNADRILRAAGLTFANVVKTVDYLHPDGLAGYKHTGRVRREHLGTVYPGSTGILMRRLLVPGALMQVDFVASREAAHAVNPGWERYGKLTYSPAVRAGNVLFMSGQASLDPATERAVHAGDITAQAEYTYRNIVAVLEAARAGPQHLVKTVEYVTPGGLADYRRVADVRREILREPWPASTGVVCEALLRPEFLIEIDPLAVLDS